MKEGKRGKRVMMWIFRGVDILSASKCDSLKVLGRRSQPRLAEFNCGTLSLEVLQRSEEITEKCYKYEQHDEIPNLVVTSHHFMVQLKRNLTLCSSWILRREIWICVPHEYWWTTQAGSRLLFKSKQLKTLKPLKVDFRKTKGWFQNSTVGWPGIMLYCSKQWLAQNRMEPLVNRLLSFWSHPKLS